MFVLRHLKKRTTWGTVAAILTKNNTNLGENRKKLKTLFLWITVNFKHLRILRIVASWFIHTNNKNIKHMTVNQC